MKFAIYQLRKDKWKPVGKAGNVEDAVLFALALVSKRPEGPDVQVWLTHNGKAAVCAFCSGFPDQAAAKAERSLIEWPARLKKWKAGQKEAARKAKERMAFLDEYLEALKLFKDDEFKRLLFDQHDISGARRRAAELGHYSRHVSLAPGA